MDDSSHCHAPGISALIQGGLENGGILPLKANKQLEAGKKQMVRTSQFWPVGGASFSKWTQKGICTLENLMLIEARVITVSYFSHQRGSPR